MACTYLATGRLFKEEMGTPVFQVLLRDLEKKKGFLGGDSWCILAIPVGLEIPNGKYFNLGIKTHGKH